MTLFLRGRGARGLNRKNAPTSVSQKLALTLLFYAAFGCFSLTMMQQHISALSIYLHAMTFAFLGLFVAASAGEILFNKEEADILLHRPIDPQTMLWAKIRVLVEISLWIAGASSIWLVFSPDSRFARRRLAVSHRARHFHRVRSLILHRLHCADLSIVPALVWARTSRKHDDSDSDFGLSRAGDERADLAPGGLSHGSRVLTRQRKFLVDWPHSAGLVRRV